MKKVKFLSVLLTAVILLQSFTGIAFAVNDVIMNTEKVDILDTIITASANKSKNTRSIATITMDGNVKLETVSTVSPFNFENDLSAYVPNRSEISFANTIVTDDHGLQHMTGTNVDARTGKIVAYYDINGDGGFDFTRSGTASLQNHDILISCMHTLWAADYVTDDYDGWPIKIDFFAGVTSTSLVATASVLQYSFDADYVSQIQNGVQHTDGDWAILQIDKDLGSTCGWYGLHGTNEPEIGFEVYSLGYPGVGGYSGWDQWKGFGVLGNLIPDNCIYVNNMYACDGFSGAPIIKDGCVYAILTSIDTVNNTVVSVRMVPWLFGMIVGAREESEERWS